MNFDFLTLLNKSILGFRHSDTDSFSLLCGSHLPGILMKELRAGDFACVPSKRSLSVGNWGLICMEEVFAFVGTIFPQYVTH